MKKHVLMIHEVGEWLFDLPLQSYTLTFDDGLYTQYHYLKRLIKIDTDKIFFISTNIVADATTTQSSEYITCDKAHEKYRLADDRSNYMNWKQIKEIDENITRINEVRNVFICIFINLLLFYFKSS